MSCYVPEYSETCENICVLGSGGTDYSCLENCYAFVGCPWPPGSSSSGSSSIDLSPETVDSVMAAFNLGFQSGVLSFIHIVGIAVIALVIVSLVNYVISKT